LEIAEQQQGFFTTKEAKAAGFAENAHSYQVAPPISRIALSSLSSTLAFAGVDEF
jgi:hypothetical protein